MGLVDINHNPSQEELKWFGLIAFLYLGIVGILIWLRFDLLRLSVVLWTFAILLVGIFYAVPALKRPIYLIWMYTFFPLSWTVSHILFAAVFYLVMTPIKLGLTLVSYDPLGRRWDRSADTYWHEHNPASDPKRYFRQF